MSKTFGMIGGGGGGIKLASIAITTPPAKTTYTVGETFDPAGMVVEATYSNGAKAVATGYSYTPSTALTNGTTAVTIQYTEGGVTKTAEQAITVSKAAGSLSISPTSLTLDETNPAGEIIVDRAGDGAISAVSSAPDIAKVSVSGNIVTVTGKASGNATITISVAEGTNHTAPASKTCAVTVQLLPAVGTPLNDYTWEQIKEISDAGLASSYFNVGDRKAVTHNGTVGSLSLNGTYYCYIIGIDHNSAIEGTNRIHFQFGYTAASGGVHIAFIDSGYATRKTSGSWFNMNNTDSNSGGWKSSLMRTVICPAFKSAMPSDLQAVLKTVTKYSDNTGGGSNTASYMTATTDDIFLLAEWEVFGARKYANSAEQNYQAKYAYYSAGNSKVRYRHSATGSTSDWRLRSVHADTPAGFCVVGTSGNASVGGASYSRGFAPAFCV